MSVQTGSLPDVVFPFLAEEAARATEEPDRRSTREQLISAAAGAFADSGFDGVSIRDIERRAGVNRGLVAHYFGTKEALWHASVDWLMREFAGDFERYRDLIRLVSVGERPRIFMKVFIHFVQKHPEFFRLIVQEGNKPTERSRELSDRYMRPLEEFWRRATGVSADLPAENHAIRHFILLGASLVFATPEYCKQMFGIDATDEQFADHFAEVIAEMWLRVSDLVEAPPAPTA
jgi:TetR/AcrR family transcriptional regulator